MTLSVLKGLCLLVCLVPMEAGMSSSFVLRVRRGGSIRKSSRKASDWAKRPPALLTLRRAVVAFFVSLVDPFYLVDADGPEAGSGFLSFSSNWQASSSGPSKALGAGAGGSNVRTFSDYTSRSCAPSG